ncbi:hypothetical protein Tco_0781442, partial [Tanacetum coccineum]
WSFSIDPKTTVNLLSESVHEAVSRGCKEQHRQIESVHEAVSRGCKEQHRQIEMESMTLASTLCIRRALRARPHMSSSIVFGFMKFSTEDEATSAKVAMDGKVT